MTKPSADATALSYARVAGLAYAYIIITAPISAMMIDARLIIAGDDAATVANITEHGLLFRISIVLTLFMYSVVVVLAHALYVVLRRVNENLALLAMLLRLAEAIVGVATVLPGIAVVLLLTDSGYATTFQPQQLHALVGLLLDLRVAGMDLVLVLIGLGGTLFCSLFFKSRLIPRPLAAWGIYTYASMVVLATISILIPNHSTVLEVIIYGPGALFELIIGLWLLIKGISLDPKPAASPTT